MASIQKRIRPNGQPGGYVVKWRNRDGSYKTKGGFRTKKEAEDYVATEVEPKRRRRASFDHNAGRALFRDTAQEWLASRHDLKETTVAAYREALAPTTSATKKKHARLVRLRIDEVFGGYPLDAITRRDISDWVERLKSAGKSPSTIRNAYFLVRQVLGQAVVDGRLEANPADYVRLPTEHNTGMSGTVDDPSQFLTAAQLSALVAATPWPFNLYVHVAAWAGLRAAELAALQIADVTLPPKPLNPNTQSRPGSLRIDRTVQVVGGELRYLRPKTKGSRRRVPLTAETTDLLREYLKIHPRADEPTAPLFPAVSLVAQRPSGVRAELPAGTKPSHAAKALRQASALAELSVDKAEKRLALDWLQPVKHANFYKAVYRPAVLRANRLMPTAKLPTTISWHALRHTYASLCVAAGIPAFDISRFMGHAKPTTTLGIYAHLFEDTQDEAMSALGAMQLPVSQPDRAGNVIPLRV